MPRTEDDYHSSNRTLVLQKGILNSVLKMAENRISSGPSESLDADLFNSHTKHLEQVIIYSVTAVAWREDPAELLERIPSRSGHLDAGLPSQSSKQVPTIYCIFAAPIFASLLQEHHCQNKL